ncbi:small subunit processome component 20 [Dorcoceras hygrometricum]|uniref:Small subunit processome component 20 n=1 Tax=Dorcoceras hygrometricum TaxID=472368 RepID=A0A2Z7BEE1_9LAMI|nr:small subunit processome component 20 [Dorcoceras hygrometricum]
MQLTAWQHSRQPQLNKIHKKPARKFSTSTTAIVTQHKHNKATAAQHTATDTSTFLFQSCKYKLNLYLAQSYKIPKLKAQSRTYYTHTVTLSQPIAQGQQLTAKTKRKFGQPKINLNIQNPVQTISTQGRKQHLRPWLPETKLNSAKKCENTAHVASLLFPQPGLLTTPSWYKNLSLTRGFQSWYPRSKLIGQSLVPVHKTSSLPSPLALSADHHN